MRATLILGGWVAALCMIGFFIMGQPYAVLLGVLMGISIYSQISVPEPSCCLGCDSSCWGYRKAVMLGVTAAVVGITRNMIYPGDGRPTGLSLLVITVFVGRSLGCSRNDHRPDNRSIIVKVFQSGIRRRRSDLKVFSDISRKLTGLAGITSNNGIMIRICHHAGFAPGDFFTYRT